jgi:hypothetical protein
MTTYLLLLYAPDGDEAERQRRWAELPEWDEVTDGLRATAKLISNAALEPAELATTVRLRHGEVEVTDGPFAVTKELLAGFYLLDCVDLDDAMAQAVRLPMARYGSIEIRPIVEVPPRIDSR